MKSVEEYINDKIGEVEEGMLIKWNDWERYHYGYELTYNMCGIVMAEVTTIFEFRLLQPGVS